MGKCAELVIISKNNNQNNSLRSILFLTFKKPIKSKGMISMDDISGFYGSVQCIPSKEAEREKDS